MPASDAPAPLTQVELAVIRELHADCCDPDCDVPNLFAAIDALAAERDALKAATGRAMWVLAHLSGDPDPTLAADADTAYQELRAALDGAAGGDGA
jgi:hypothetical protein